jgi:hypothetical protein
MSVNGMKKLALIFFGISYHKNFNHWTGRNYCIDFRKSYENYKEYIYDHFHKLGYKVDVYFATNNLDELDINELINMYVPKSYVMVDNDNNVYKSRNSKLLAAIKCCLDSKVEYETCLITRFDLLFQKDFGDSNIDFDKINIVSLLESPNLICDNFYLLPYKLLHSFYDLVQKNQYGRFHDMLCNILKISDVNYILNENNYVKELSFYKIVRVPC